MEESKKHMDNQENHPIDEWFAQKLLNLEQTPSAQGWEAIQSRMDQQNKSSRKGWYYVAAASVALVAACLWVFMPHTDPASVAGTVRHTIPAHTQKPVRTVVQPPLQVASVAAQKETMPATMELPQIQLPKSVKKRVVKQSQAEVVERLATQQKVVLPKITSPKETTALPDTQVAQQTITEKPSEDVWVVVVELPEEIAQLQADSTTPQAAQTREHRVGKFLKTLKKAKTSEIPIEKENLLTWVKRQK